MLPKFHALISFIFIIILKQISSFDYFQLLVIFLAAIFIDFDHYLAFVLMKKNLSLKKAYNYYIKLIEKINKGINVKCPLCIFHTIEFLIPFGILSYFNGFIFLIFCGFIFHLLVDIVHGLITKTLKFRGLSVIMYVLKNG